MQQVCGIAVLAMVLVSCSGTGPTFSNAEQHDSNLGYPVDIETNPHVGDGGLSINVENFRLN